MGRAVMRGEQLVVVMLNDLGDLGYGSGGEFRL